MAVKTSYMTLQVMGADDTKRQQLIDRMIEITLEPGQTVRSGSNEVILCMNREGWHTNVIEGHDSAFESKKRTPTVRGEVNGEVQRF